MKIRNFFLLVLLIGLLSSCGQDKMQLVTKKIQYDVNIKSPDPSYDWWIQNLVGPDRQQLVDVILDGALEGKFQAYDYFNQPITPAQVKQLFADTMLVSFRQLEPPYELYDSLIIHNIEREDIQRLRFMEEWKMNPNNLDFEKKIFGLAPVARRVDSRGIERWQPLFWIYTDQEFLKSTNH
jgi:hypothetical protein